MDLSLLDNPMHIQALIGSKIQVTTITKKQHTGYLHVVDPVTRCFVVAFADEDGTQLKLIPSQVVQAFEILEGEKRMFEVDGVKMRITENEIDKRRAAVKEWLERNLIEVIEDGKKLICGEHLIIEPPYNSSSCLCTNTIILERVTGILNRMEDEVFL